MKQHRNAYFSAAAVALAAMASGPGSLAAGPTPIPAKSPGIRRIDIPPPGQSGLPAPQSGQGVRAGMAVVDHVLWDAWYTVTVSGNRYEYYNEKVELKAGKVFYQNHVWKQEEDFLNEEQLGGVAQGGADLVPLFYNFHSTYRSTETTIDGNVKDGKTLTVRIRKGNTELPVVRKVIPQKTIFSSFFALWLSYRLRELQPGRSLPFLTILEDNIDLNFSTVSGTARLEQPDAFANQTGTRKIQIDYRDLRSFWWVDKAGVPVREEIPTQKLVVERVPEEKAKKFLDE